MVNEADAGKDVYLLCCGWFLHADEVYVFTCIGAHDGAASYTC